MSADLFFFFHDPQTDLSINHFNFYCIKQIYYIFRLTLGIQWAINVHSNNLMKFHRVCLTSAQHCTLYHSTAFLNLFQPVHPQSPKCFVVYPNKHMQKIRSRQGFIVHASSLFVNCKKYCMYYFTILNKSLIDF